MIAKVAVVGITVGDEFPVRSGAFEGHEFAASGYSGERAQQRRLNPTENGSVGGNADCQRDHGHQREAGALTQHSETKTNVLDKAGHASSHGSTEFGSSPAPAIVIPDGR